MLRRKSQSAETGQPELKGFAPLPSTSEPFVLGQGLFGIHFYQPKEVFYCAYSTLHSLRLIEESLTLVFTSEQVQVEGRGLHSLYLQIAEHKVKRVHEQGERFEGLAGEAVFIRRIERRGRSNSSS